MDTTESEYEPEIKTNQVFKGRPNQTEEIITNNIKNMILYNNYQSGCPNVEKHHAHQTSEIMLS